MLIHKTTWGHSSRLAVRRSAQISVAAWSGRTWVPIWLRSRPAVQQQSFRCAAASQQAGQSWPHKHDTAAPSDFVPTQRPPRHGQPHRDRGLSERPDFSDGDGQEASTSGRGWSEGTRQSNSYFGGHQRQSRQSSQRTPGQHGRGQQGREGSWAGRNPGRGAWIDDRRSPRQNNYGSRGSDRPDPWLEAGGGAGYRGGMQGQQQASWQRPDADREPSLQHRIKGEALYGVSPITAALAAGRRRLHTLYIQEGLQASKRKDMGACQAAIAAAQAAGVEMCEVEKHELNLASGDRPHQGLVLDCEPLKMETLNALPRPRMQPGQSWPLWLALDEIQDPQNLGAILRSAYFLGATGVLCCAKNSAPLSPVVAKASSGALDAMTLYACSSMPRFLTGAAEAGWTIVGADVHEGSTDLASFALSAPTLLVLGSEGRGLRPLVRQACQQALRIATPTPRQDLAGVDSLNVSVAAGVMLHHLLHSQPQGNAKVQGPQHEAGGDQWYTLSDGNGQQLDTVSVKTELAGIASEELGVIA